MNYPLPPPLPTPTRYKHTILTHTLHLYHAHSPPPPLVVIATTYLLTTHHLTCITSHPPSYYLAPTHPPYVPSPPFLSGIKVIISLSSTQISHPHPIISPPPIPLMSHPLHPHYPPSPLSGIKVDIAACRAHYLTLLHPLSHPLHPHYPPSPLLPSVRHQGGYRRMSRPSSRNAHL